MTFKALQLGLQAAACGCAAVAPESRPAGEKGWLPPERRLLPLRFDGGR